MRVEVGGGTKCRTGYVNFDPMRNDAWGGRLGYDRIPVEDASVEAAYASHVMEHIPQGQPRIDALNEVWRILKPGAPFEIIVPCVGWTDHADNDHRPTRPPGTTGSGGPHHNGWQAYGDPTHTSFWWYPESFWYLGKPGFSANADYGMSEWTLGEMYLADLWEAHVTLLKPTNGAR